MNTNKLYFNKTCNYIDKHLDQKLALDQLCKIEHLSKYHFHRLFHLEVGLPVYQYIKLQRMKKAANQVYYYHHLSITQIALDAGFENTESFSRAFKSLFSVTPTQFKKSPNWTPITENIKRENSTMKSSQITDVKIQWFEKTQIASLSHKGSPQTLHTSIKRFINWRKAHHTTPGLSKTYNILYNDPNTTPEDEYQFDIATNITEKNLTSENNLKENKHGVKLKEIPEGYCAVLRYSGSDDNLGELINLIYSEWLPQSGKQLRDFPCFIERVKMFPAVNQNEAVTDIYLPIQ
ncbi:GyrI-like domain-containing protein [Pseudocolwellia sp. AS88]|uniref:AraC family transcriptional regulator n=1 Tax=Pseudocolwellia sp. AS88 TaxID=3063958 RepID=UPI0026F1A7CA|nr:GyrI-like domain-containing protein [Pseudocolwellia sp. AS88]MDO7083472.1 GyrI-like domain-containing protein [Pseudocolwellia sp. AS88]